MYGRFARRLKKKGGGRNNEVTARRASPAVATHYLAWDHKNKAWSQVTYYSILQTNVVVDARMKLHPAL